MIAQFRVRNNTQQIDCGEAERKQREVKEMVIVRHSVNFNLFSSFFFYLNRNAIEIQELRFFEGK